MESQNQNHTKHGTQNDPDTWYLVVLLCHSPVPDCEEKDLINFIPQNIMIMTKEIRNNYILVVTGDTNSLDLSTLVEDFQLPNLVDEPTRGDRVPGLIMTNRPRYYSVDLFNTILQGDFKAIYAKPTQLCNVLPINVCIDF